MNYRLLLKGIVVGTMGAAALTTPRHARATTLQPCYLCVQMDGCPDQATGDAICSANLGPFCPTMASCTELMPPCTASQVFIDCF